jgi:hypothetical protein
MPSTRYQKQLLVTRITTSIVNDQSQFPHEEAYCFNSFSLRKQSAQNQAPSSLKGD